MHTLIDYSGSWQNSNTKVYYHFTCPGHICPDKQLLSALSRALLLES